jgi:hypothetical protein
MVEETGVPGENHQPVNITYGGIKHHNHNHKCIVPIVKNSQIAHTNFFFFFSVCEDNV